MSMRTFLLSSLIGSSLVALGIFALPALPTSYAMANPSSVYCVDHGGKLDIRKLASGSEYGVCVFDDKTECEEWAFMAGECAPGEHTSWEADQDKTPSIDFFTENIYTTATTTLNEYGDPIFVHTEQAKYISLMFTIFNDNGYSGTSAPLRITLSGALSAGRTLDGLSGDVHSDLFIYFVPIPQGGFANLPLEQRTVTITVSNADTGEVFAERYIDLDSQRSYRTKRTPAFLPLKQVYSYLRSEGVSIFDDVMGNTFATIVYDLYMKGIIHGATPTAFLPHNTLNRAEAAKLLISAYFHNESATPATFQDVPKDSWYAQAVAVAKVKGIIQGTSPSSFEPGRAINRAEFLKILLKSAKVDVEKLSDEYVRDMRQDRYHIKFSDITGTEWFAPYVFAANQLGIDVEDESFTFNPGEAVSRYQAATWLYRLDPKALPDGPEVRDMEAFCSVMWPLDVHSGNPSCPMGCVAMDPENAHEFVCRAE